MADKKYILIIDDDPDILDAIQAILMKSGFKTATATSGAEGIEAVKKSRPDCILCDMMMEAVDSGSKVAQQIKSSVPGVPIYLLSSIGSATASNIEIDKLGFNGFFQKPVDPKYLVSVMKDVLK